MRAGFLVPLILLSSCALARPRLDADELKELKQEAYKAFREDDLEAFKRCFARGLPINYRRGEESPLHWVARSGKLEFAEWLIKQGAAVNAVDSQDYTPLHDASHRKSVEMVKFLLENKANPNSRGGRGEMGRDFPRKETPLHDATYSNMESISLAMVKLLVAHGADINVKNFNGTTPLYNAIFGKKNPWRNSC
jgi:serine/threonine-protein phosphatase 6 regulatory ankyrin repeat subunit B